MNTSKAGNYGKMIAFFIVAVILLCSFGFAADGWQSLATQPDSGKVEDTNDNADENTDGGDENPEVPIEPSEPEIYIPEYVNFITGTETSGELARSRPTCFVMSSASPLYGTSGADLIAEFPLEDGTTRLLVFTQDARSLGKIGSIAPSRRYISNVAKFFGAISVLNGYDDTVDYVGCDMTSSAFDLSVHSGYHYTEYTHFAYSNGALINAGIANANIGTAVNARQPLPYTFTPFGGEDILGDTSARSIILPFSSSSETELYYSEEDKTYLFSKGGISKNDMLNDGEVRFDNAFILFADTVTYESAEASEMVMDTVGAGIGYYFTRGTAVKIIWESDAAGTMTFYTEGGEKLTVNRGSSYIGFLKSSMINDVKFS